mgnify:CR=1 FL=1
MKPKERVLENNVNSLDIKRLKKRPRKGIRADWWKSNLNWLWGGFLPSPQTPVSVHSKDDDLVEEEVN